VPDFRRRLNRAQQREYDRSNAVSAIPVRVSPRLHRAIELLPAVLQSGARPKIQILAQAVCDELCRSLRVASARVVVKGTRPSNERGELHGLFTSSPGKTHVIEVWMVTAKRGQIVAFKTFLRTLVHEICHHLDYSLLGLRESFHTDGFFKRESSLVHQLLPPPSGSVARDGKV
jgi:hypothetical protein